MNYYFERNQASFIGSDCSFVDRQKALRTVGKPLPLRNGFIAPGIRANAVVGEDVSLMDRRSVKSQLAGFFSWRVAWWNLNAMVYKMLNRHATIESAMYWFHSGHQRVTLAWLESCQKTDKICRNILSGGRLVGMKTTGVHSRREDSRT